MFPTLQFNVMGLESDLKYNVFVDVVLVDTNIWKFQGGKWVPCGPSPNSLAKTQQSPKSAKTGGNNLYMHPDSPKTGTQWMKNEIVFNKVKLTNNKANAGEGGNILLNSMHKYVPRVHVAVDNDPQSVRTFVFYETQFIAVTAYQNTDVSLRYSKYSHHLIDYVYLDNSAQN